MILKRRRQRHSGGGWPAKGAQAQSSEAREHRFDAEIILAVMCRKLREKGVFDDADIRHVVELAELQTQRIMKIDDV